MHTGEAYGPDGTRVKLREYEAYFERKGDGALAYGGDNEMMIYSPNLDEPDKKESIVLAGKNSHKQWPQHDAIGLTRGSTGARRASLAWFLQFCAPPGQP